jgi:hypothetical protein
MKVLYSGKELGAGRRVIDEKGWLLRSSYYSIYAFVLSVCGGVNGISFHVGMFSL